MRKIIASFLIASAAMVGVADATPTLGASSHRLGGEMSGKYAAQEEKAASFLEGFLEVLTFDISANAMPIAERRSLDKKTGHDECNQAGEGNAEVAQAEPESSSEKVKHPNLEPMFLAF